MILTVHERRQVREEPRDYHIRMKGILIFESKKIPLEVAGHAVCINNKKTVIFVTNHIFEDMPFRTCKLLLDWPVKLHDRVALTLDISRETVKEIVSLMDGSKITAHFR